MYAVVLLTLFVALTNIYFDFDTLVEFNIFTYFVYFAIEIGAYLILKHNEPDAPRKFEIPYGKIGGWIVSIVLLIAVGICFFVVAVDDVRLFAIACVVNFIMVMYYMLAKRFCHRMDQNDILPQYQNLKEVLSADEDDAEYGEIQPLI